MHKKSNNFGLLVTESKSHFCHDEKKTLNNNKKEKII